MKIVVNQPVSLADQRIEIIVFGLQPGAKLTLRASMSLPWAQNVVFGSKAEFIADNNGCVDLSKQAPVFGDYLDTDSMGLLTSMSLISGKISEVAENISVDNSIFINIAAECETERTTITIERRFMSPDIKTEKITEPFTGYFYYSENPNNKTILMLGGSDGRIASNLPITALLASHGYNVITVAYFRETGLPKELTGISLEYFEKIFDWLSNKPYTKNKDLYLHCTSKGGELGLLLASKYSFIKKVAAFAPHAYCFQGISFKKRTSSWYYQNRPLPYIHLKYSTMLFNMLACFIKNKPFGYSHTYKSGLKSAGNQEEARIKIENAKTDLLLFAGKQDNIWNASDGCIKIMNVLDKVNYPYIHEFIAYENAGHPFYAPYIIPIEVFGSMKLAPRLVFSSGGTLKGNSEAQIDSWNRMLYFFES
jgi:dienelactone hydrolase